jgi:hypothetical protein
MTFAPEALTQLRWPSMSLLTALVSAALLLFALLFAYPLLAATIRTIDDLPPTSMSAPTLTWDF